MMLHIIGLLAFLCICVATTTFLLTNGQNAEGGRTQPKMSEVASSRMESIVKTLLDGDLILVQRAIDDTHTASGSESVFLIVHTDQDCSVCLREMMDFVDRVTTEFEIPIFAVNRSGKRQFSGQNIVHLEYGNLTQNSQILNVPTPMFVYLNQTGEVKAAFISTLSDDQERETEFLDTVRKLIPE